MKIQWCSNVGCNRVSSVLFQCRAVSTTFFQWCSSVPCNIRWVAQWCPSAHWVDQWHFSGIAVYIGAASIHWHRVKGGTVIMSRSFDKQCSREVAMSKTHEFQSNWSLIVSKRLYLKAFNDRDVLEVGCGGGVGGVGVWGCGGGGGGGGVVGRRRGMEFLYCVDDVGVLYPKRGETQQAVVVLCAIPVEHCRNIDQSDASWRLKSLVEQHYV